MFYCEAFLAAQATILEFYRGNPYKQRTDIADAVTQAVRQLQLKKAQGTIEALRELNLTTELDTVLAQYSTEDAHPDELARGFKKRKYGETDRPSRASLAFNE
jgi:alcohol dehydrogenase class IV